MEVFNVLKIKYVFINSHFLPTIINYQEADDHLEISNEDGLRYDKRGHREF